MYYIKFNSDGIQQETRLSDEAPDTENIWYAVGDSVDHKFFHLVNGQPTPMTDEERKDHYAILNKNSVIMHARYKRDRALIESDWTQLPNSKLTDAQKTEWETYRQALRDYPANVENNLDLELPEKPQ